MLLAAGGPEEVSWHSLKLEFTQTFWPQVLLKWNVQRGVAVIPKASSPDHMRSNIEGLFEWRLSYEQKVRCSPLGAYISSNDYRYVLSDKQGISMKDDKGQQRANAIDVQGSRKVRRRGRGSRRHSAAV